MNKSTAENDFIQDLEQQEAEERIEELLEANNKLIHTLESISDGVFTLDREWRVTYWNRAAEIIFDCKREDILGQVFWEVHPFVAGPDFYQEHHRAVAEKRPAFFEKLRSHTGRWVEARAYPSKDGVTVFINDITKRKLAEEELEKSRNKIQDQAHFFNSLLANTRDTVQVWNLDKELVYANLSLIRHLGLKTDNYIGKRAGELGYPHEVAEFFDRNIEETAANNKAVKSEISCSTPTGVFGYWDYIFSPILGNDGRVEYVVCVGRETTERRRAEKEMARLECLNMIGQMAASIGHEIRNPMTTVRGFLQMLNEKEENKKYRTYYALMIEELDRCNSIITDYLSMARDKIVDIKPVCLSSIVEALYPMLRADALYSDKMVQLQLNSTTELMLNEKELRQLIINLARNGLEAMEGEGVLTIRTKEEGGKVILEVADQGNGISSDILEKLGTPFTTTKENGTGIGLAVCYNIAQRNNATIEVESSPQGTTFSVFFAIHSVE